MRLDLANIPGTPFTSKHCLFLGGVARLKLMWGHVLLSSVWWNDVSLSRRKCHRLGATSMWNDVKSRGKSHRLGTISIQFFLRCSVTNAFSFLVSEIQRFLI